MLIQQCKTQLSYLYEGEMCPIFTEQIEHTRDVIVNLHNTLFSPMPLHCIVLLSFFLHVIWLIHVLCNSRCYLAAVFHDVNGAGCHLKICLTCFCSSPTLSCLIYVNWPSNLGLSGLLPDMCISCLGQHSLWEYYYSTQYLTGL